MGAGGSFPGKNYETDHSSPSSSKVKNECSHTSTPTPAFSASTGTNLTFDQNHFYTTLCTEPQLKERYDFTDSTSCRQVLFLGSVNWWGNAGKGQIQGGRASWLQAPQPSPAKTEI
jgi:hypothetical protein